MGMGKGYQHPPCPFTIPTHDNFACVSFPSSTSLTCFWRLKNGRADTHRFGTLVVVASGDYYDTLGVYKSTSGKDIKAAYRRLARQDSSRRYLWGVLEGFFRGPPWDLYAYLDVQEVPRIQRDSINLTSTVSISYLDAILESVVKEHSEFYSQMMVRGGL